jgi:hypothetical protein
MKNLFGIKKNGLSTYENFVLHQVSEQTEIALDDAEFEVQMQAQKAVPKWLNWLLTGVAFGAAICIAIILRTDLPIAETYARVPYLFYIGGVLCVAAIALYAYIFYKNKKLKENPEFQTNVSNAKNKLATSKLELGVPANKVTIDVLCPLVKENKNGEEKKAFNINGNFVANLAVDVYVEGDNLCFADSVKVIAVPLYSVKSITKVKKWTGLAGWNKEEKINSKTYKPYKLFYYDGKVDMRWHYSVVADVWGEEYEIQIPNYDIENFRKVVPLEIQEPKKKGKKAE